MKKNKALQILVNWDLVVSGAMLCLLVICTFVGAISRYLFSAPFTWLEEIQTMCQVWIVFCGGCAAFRLGGHIEIEFIAESLPEKGQKIVQVINSVIITLVLGYLGVQSLKYIQVFISSGRVTNILHLSYVVIYGIAPVTIAFMLIYYYATLGKVWHRIETECAEKKAKKLKKRVEGGEE